jgi:Tol biopolymer transport system component
VNTLAIIDLHDGKQTQITSNALRGNLTSAAWLNSSEFVFAQFEQISTFLNPPAQVFIKNIDTGKQTPLFWTNDLAGNFDVAGSSKLVFDISQMRENLREITRDNISEGRWLTTGYAQTRQPFYSPDNEWVYFSSNQNENLDLWKVNLHNRALIRITDDAANDWDPGLTPDGKRLVWSSNRGGSFEIWSANADGSGAIQLSHDGQDAENPVITPDGRWVVYASYNPSKRGLWKVGLDGRNTSKIFETQANLPDISPDGKYLLFFEDAVSSASVIPIPHFNEGLSQGQRLRVVRLEDNKIIPFEIRVTASTYPYFVIRSHWSEDGKHILFIDLSKDGKSGLFEQDFLPDQDTTNTRKVIIGFDSGLQPETFALSRDGSRIIYSSTETANSLMIAENVRAIQTSSH